MLVLDDTESRHGAECNRVRPVLVSGAFETTGDACVGSGFHIGEKFGGWTMTEAVRKRTPVIRLGAAVNTTASTAPAHCFDGHLAVLSGTMSQTLVTEAGVSYKLAFESYGAGLEVACSICDVVIDGTVVQTIVTEAQPDAVLHETYFTAQSDETVLSFSTIGREPFTLGNVTASTVAQVVFSDRDILRAMFAE